MNAITKYLSTHGLPAECHMATLIGMPSDPALIWLSDEYGWQQEPHGRQSAGLTVADMIPDDMSRDAPVIVLEDDGDVTIFAHDGHEWLRGETVHKISLTT